MKGEVNEDAPRILIIRRDNIGDLVCTTPLIAALRAKFPDAYLAALVNSYNRDALAGNPRLDAVFAYTKAKHRDEGESLLGAYFDRIRVFLALRRVKFDYAILATPHYQPHALRFARAAGAAKVIGFVDQDGQRGIDLAVPYGGGATLHEAEDVFRLGAPLGIEGAVPPLEVFAEHGAQGRVSQALTASAMKGVGPLVAVHISARKPSQRWPAAHFAEVMRNLQARHDARFLLLWAPGSELNPQHPGDDQKADEVIKLSAGLPVLPWPTARLTDLVAALSLADAVLCADGGAMHLAAGLGKPIACLFGDSGPSRWRPWGVPHVVLQPTSRDVADVGVAEAVAALEKLISRG